MEFTIQEMEMICFFHAGTMSATLTALATAAEQIEFPRKKVAAESAIAKLSELKAGETVALAFIAEQ